MKTSLQKTIPRVAPKAYEYVKNVLDFGFHNAHSVGITARLESEFAQRFGHTYGIAHCNAIPVIVDDNPDRYPQFAGRLPDYERGTCPLWEKLQPRIIMLKTNYFDTAEVDRQAGIFEKTIRRFN